MARHSGLIAALLFVAAWGGAFLFWTGAGQDPSDVLAVAVALGVLAPALAFLLTLRAAPPPPAAPTAPREILFLALWVLVIAAWLGALGPSGISQAAFGLTPDTRAEAIAKVIEKLAMFVVVPGAVFLLVFRRGLRTFGIRRGMLNRRAALTFLGMAAFYTVLQFALGTGGDALVDGTYGPLVLAAGLPLAFVWLAVEAGLVEEFFFRALMQERLGKALRSPVAGLFLAAIVFAMAHVPGLALRGELADAGWALSAAYAMLVLAPAALALGVLWLRTRNLLLVVSVHAFVDLIPNFGKTAGWLGLTPVS